MASLASNFSSYLYKQMGSLFIVWSIWNLPLCAGILESENFETCGIFLQNVQPNSSKYSDITHDIIEHLQLKQTRPQSLIIKNELSLRYIQPDIFRSTKYDCYLYVYINFGNDIFSTIPLPSWESFQNPEKSVVHKNGLFLVIVARNPFEMFTHESRKLHLDRPYRIFVCRVEITRTSYHNITKQFELH